MTGLGCLFTNVGVDVPCQPVEHSRGRKVFGLRGGKGGESHLRGGTVQQGQQQVDG